MNEAERVPTQGEKPQNSPIYRKKPLPAEDLAVFCSEVAMMLRAGISLPDGIGAIAGHAAPGARKMLLELKDKLESFIPLSEALSGTGVFPKDLIEMAGIGESAGTLEQVMEAMSAHYQREHELRRQVKSAVTYPIVTLVMMAVVLGVLTAKVFPVFTRMFETMGSGMSEAAAAAVSLGGIFSRVVAIAALVLVVLGAVIWLMGFSGKGRELRSKISVKLPLIRRFSAKISAARFCDCFSMLLSGGYNAEEALERISAMLPDPTVRARVEGCRKDLVEGKSLTDALVATGLFDGLQNGLIAVAAQSGSLDTTLKSIADQDLNELDQLADRAVSLIEPIMIGLTAVMIGSILLSVMLPLAGVMASIG